MSVRLGFDRLERLYWRRWWIIVIAPPPIFLYRWLSTPRPAWADPTLWFLGKPVLYAAITTFVLILLTWVVSGFAAPPSDAETRLRK